MMHLCRHGETAFNKEGRIQGQMESSLTHKGRLQAAAMADLLLAVAERDGPFEGPVLSSPLGRARETAAIIAARLHSKVALDDRLLEIAMGAWQGRLRDDIARDHPDLFVNEDWQFRSPGGETFGQVERRVGLFLQDHPPDSSRRVVVSHGVAGRLLRGVYAGLGRSETLKQPAPHDCIFRLQEGRIDRLQCRAV